MNAEIINADSTQIYKEANIGTAKITEKEMEGIKHHLINIVSLKQDYSVKEYQSSARKILDSLIKENKNVIIVGGSGLYLKALLYDYRFSDEEGSINYDNYKNEELKARVDQLYEGNNIHLNNRKRLIRFLSHYDLTGEIIKNNNEKDKPLYDFTLIGLTAPREELYKYLNDRVEIMMCDGLLEECRSLYNNGFEKANRLIGYKEFFDYFKGDINLVTAIDETQKRTRNFAKRQYTWYNHQFKNIKWFNVNYKDFNETIKKIEDYLDSL